MVSHENEVFTSNDANVSNHEVKKKLKLKNKRTLDNHRWFVSKIEKITNIKIKNEDEKNKYINKMLLIVLIILISFSIITHLIRSEYIILLNRLLILYTYLLFIYVHDNKLHLIRLNKIKKEKENTIFNMRFTRLGIFYKNTHYIFLGTKKELENVFDKMRLEIEEEKKEKYFNRGDHNNLLDMPLDTFCTDDCGCENELYNDVYNEENYICSHWDLYNYETYEKMLQDIEKIKNDKDNGYNEITYL
jgi:hypothetical protein